MFSKRKNQVFTQYYHTDKAERWESDLRELRDNGFQYLVISENFDLKNILATDARKDLLVQFLDAAHSHELRCIINPGNPRELYILPDARRWRLDYIRHVAETLGDHPAVYALMLEDGPTGGANASFERWKSATAELEGLIESDNLTADGYQLAVKSWQMDQYAVYTGELVGVIKKARSKLKTTVCFHMDAVFPSNSLVHYQKTAEHLDFVMLNPVVGFSLDAEQMEDLPRFAANVGVSLLDKPLWVYVGSHAENGRYRSTPRDLREWSRQTSEQGVAGIGWRGWDFTHWHESYSVRGAPYAETKPEFWTTILSLSRDQAESETSVRDAHGPAVLVSYDSYLNQTKIEDALILNRVLNHQTAASISYISDGQIVDNKALQKRGILITTPCPTISEETANQLVQFMESGGWLISAADDAALDEQMNRSDFRARLFGIVQESDILHDDQIHLGKDLASLPQGTSLPSAWCRTRILEIATGSDVVGTWGDGTAAMTLTPHGKGGALCIGTDIYRAAQATGRRSEWGRFLDSVCDADVLRELVAPE